MGNELSSLTADDLQVQLEQLQKAETEDNARELLKQEISADYSYQRLIEELIKRNVKVNRINNDFTTPRFTVR